MENTEYFRYKDADVTIKINDISTAKFDSSNQKIIDAVDKVFSSKTRKKLTSPGEAYIVYMGKDELGELFTGIEKIYNIVHNGRNIPSV